MKAEVRDFVFVPNKAAEDTSHCLSMKVYP